MENKKEMIEFKKHKETKTMFTKIIILQTLIIITLILAIIFLTRNYNQLESNIVQELARTEQESDNLHVAEVDYELIESMIVENSEQVDYEKIETIVRENQAEVEKDFGEKFEEMTSYFGEQFRSFVESVNERINK